MRFGWSEEQAQLVDMLRRYVAEQHDFDRRRERLAARDGSKIWEALSDLGVMALPFPSDFGGLDGTALDTVIVAEAFGRGLIVEPYLPSIVLAGGVLKRLPETEQTRSLLGSLAGGEVRMALAYGEPDSRYNPAWCTSSARADGTGWQLNGHKSMVFGGDEALAVIVTARIAGASGDTDGLALFMVDCDAPGLERRSFTCIDGTGAAEFSFSNVSITADARLDTGDAFAIVSAALDDAAVYACAEMCGAVAALNIKTRDYLLERKAFGQEIARFQAIQHRLVDMKVSEEQCVAITLRAAQALAGNHAKARAMVSAAKQLVSEEAREVAKQAVQMHGAIGVTDELDISHYFRRIAVLSGAFGDADHHLARRIACDAETRGA